MILFMMEERVADDEFPAGEATPGSAPTIWGLTRLRRTNLARSLRGVAQLQSGKTPYVNGVPGCTVESQDSTDSDV